jgi:hypothetical protein
MGHRIVTVSFACSVWYLHKQNSNESFAYLWRDNQVTKSRRSTDTPKLWSRYCGYSPAVTSRSGGGDFE